LSVQYNSTLRIISKRKITMSQKDEQKREEILQHIHPEFEISRGRPSPFGATLLRGGINFALFASHARSVSLVIFGECSTNQLMEFPLDPHLNRTGDVWHAFITGLDAGIRYGYRVVCEQAPAPCKKDIILLDPYTRSTCGGSVWGRPLKIKRNGQQHTFRLSEIIDNNFDWELDQPLNIPLKDSIIYELHVRGFTRHDSSGVKNPGTFKGLIEKIPYLKNLGVTAVELMPVTDFDETYPGRINPRDGSFLYNFWGYDPISFFAPKASYAVQNKNGAEVREFKQMVKAFHQAGIEVILDMVFNHTGEGDEQGPVYHFKGIDREIYYILDAESKKYLNYSGCGNTLNCNHPVVRDMILDSLRYWVTEMHVDGFRFDLASILGRGRDGSVLANPPLIERIAEDPILAHTKLIAEAWDAAGLYQVGDFPHFKRWMEWNGKFRDDVRRFVRGDEGMVPILATRLAGSSDLYQDDGREPFHSVNFVTCHDGFTLHDLVSYNTKHNLDNGEQNRDGSDYNLSWNCGSEGRSSSVKIQKLRYKQIRNFAAILLLAQGVPMFPSGDEFGRSQKGNNNAYCQDNEISWIDWQLAQTHADLLRFFKLLIAFRKNHPCLKRSRFEVEKINGTPQMRWHGLKTGRPDWSAQSKTLGLQYLLQPPEEAYSLFIMFNADKKKQVFELPSLPSGRYWYRVMNTEKESPQDILPNGQEVLLRDQKKYATARFSVVLLMAK